MSKTIAAVPETVTEPEVEGVETKSDKFKRLANARLDKILTAIGQLAPLANKSQYEYTPEQLAKLFSLIDSKVEQVSAAFKDGTAKAAKPTANYL
jgi:hypothetical protein